MKIVIELISTVFYIGYLPASGTFATLASLPLIVLYSKLNIFFQIIFLVIFIIFSIFVSSYSEQMFAKKDDRRIVIDEIVGALISVFAIDVDNIKILLIALILFRFFDILKIGMVKKLQNLPSGVGIVCDDILAGVISNIFTRFIILLWR